MKTLRLVALIGGATLLAAAGLKAQEKTSGPAVKTREVSRDQYDQMRDGAARAVSGEEAMTHGDLLAVRRVKGGTVNGTLVYQDLKNNRLMIRTRPNTAPVAIPMAEVEEIERIVPASAVGGDKGGVRFANEQDPRRGGAYEIQTLEIFNGPVRTIHYHSTTLSPAERAQLDALERAANRQAWDEYLAMNLADRAERGPAPVDLSPLTRMAPVTPPAFATASFTTVAPVDPLLTPFNGGGFPAFAGFGANTAFTAAALPALLNGPAPSPAVIEIPKNNDTQADLMKALREAQETLSKSRQEYTTASTRALFDQDGRIVAVRLDEK